MARPHARLGIPLPLGDAGAQRARHGLYDGVHVLGGLELDDLAGEDAEDAVVPALAPLAVPLVRVLDAEDARVREELEDL